MTESGCLEVRIGIDTNNYTKCVVFGALSSSLGQLTHFVDFCNKANKLG